MKRLLLLCAMWTVVANAGEVRQLAALKTGAAVGGVSVCMDGKQLVAGDRDGKLYVWSLPGGRLALTANIAAEQARSVACGDSIALGTAGGTVVFLDRSTGQVQRRVNASPHRIGNLLFSPDSRLLLVAPDDTAAQLWDARTGERLASLPTDFGGCAAAAFSPDSELLAIAGEDTTIRIYNSRGGLQSSAADFLLDTFTLSFTPDSKQLVAAGADRTITFLDAATGKIVRQLPRAPEPIAALAVSPDGRTLATSHFDVATMAKPSGYLWDTAAGRMEPAPFGDARALAAMQTTDRQALLVTVATEHGLTIWSLH